MSRIEAIANRFTGRNIRSGSQNKNNRTVRGTRGSNSPRSSTRPDSYLPADHSSRVDIMLHNPQLFYEFQRLVSKSGTSSNTGANFILHDFLEMLEYYGVGDQSRMVLLSGDTDTSSNSDNAVPTSGLNNLLKSFQSLRVDPASSSTTTQYSPRGRFNCPESPSTIKNLSPTKTPLTPMSATSSSVTPTPRSPDEGENNAAAAAKKEARSRGAMLAGLEQPSL